MGELVLIDEMTPEQIASVCDHTYLDRPESHRGRGSAMNSRRAAFYAFMDGIDELPRPYAVCVRPEDARHAREYLREEGDDDIVIAAVAGFPDGPWYSWRDKIADARIAVRGGAREIDMVLDYDRLRAGDFRDVEEDVKNVTSNLHDDLLRVKLIFENSAFDSDPDIIRRACDIARHADVDFVKTSTGFGKYGARPEDVALMRKHFHKGVKMAGGIKPENVAEMLRAASGRDDGYIELDPMKVRIGESSLLANYPAA
ncbi:MAG: deoxyribose-phosphate aldolase [Candidatus Aenigmatarchaeota archaeon]|nr:MAG: deoxyribose-phosphate aldolase [Candidatus Aenigmarchaeota archaeon]